MAQMSEATCKEMVRGVTSRMLYPYPEHEKPYSVVVLDTTAGDMTVEVMPPLCRLLSSCWVFDVAELNPSFLQHRSLLRRSSTSKSLRRQSTASWSIAGAATTSHVCSPEFKR
jgi:hypothetical protein